LRAVAAIVLDWLRLVRSQRSFTILGVLALALGIALACLKVHEDRIEILFMGDISFDGHVTGPEVLFQILSVLIGVFPFITAFIALFATGGVIPEIMRKGRVDVLLARPIARWQFVIGCYLGGLLFSAIVTSLLFVSAWIGLAIRGTVLGPLYFLNIPIVVAQYALIFVVAAWVGFLSRSSGAAILLTLVIWFAGKMAVEVSALRRMTDQPGKLGEAAQVLQGPWGAAVDVLWWVLPKPGSLSPLSSRILDHVVDPGVYGRVLHRSGVKDPDLDLRGGEIALSSGLLVLLLLGHASRRLSRRDI
jgi:ABC-type transport system involved in multi-copper enzyme maturation permease subunit